MDRIGVMLLLLAFCTWACTCCVGSFTQHTYTFQVLGTGPNGVQHSQDMTLKVGTLQ